jgi:histidine ammonia-lyase
MTVVLTGNDLALEQLLRVARRGEKVKLSPDAVARMQAGRAAVERVLTRDAPA